MGNAQLGAVLQHLDRMVTAKSFADLSDGELLERFRAAHDEAAFVALLRRHGPMVLHLCRRVGGNEHDAEDAFQATFLLLARKAPAIRKQESVASWLYAVARRMVLQAKGQDMRRQARERRVADMRKSPDEANGAWSDLQVNLEEALLEVPERYRAPLLLCHLEGKTHEEAARQLGCPIGTVRSRVARGRDKLREILARRGVCLSATALVAALAVHSASAAVPFTLLNTTAKAALAFAAGAAPAALVSAKAAALIEGGLATMFTAKAKSAMIVVLLMMASLGLGTAAIMSRVVADPPAEKAPATASNQEEKKPTPSAAKDQGDAAPRKQWNVTGQVLNSDGKPLAGAKLYVPRITKLIPTSEKDIALDVVGTADADGRFRVSFNPPLIGIRMYLIAHAEGFGVDWADFSERKPNVEEVTLRLPKDVPISGRVVNTEAKPLADVSVSVGAIYVPANEKLDDYLKGWMKSFRDNLSSPTKRLYCPIDGITGTVTTDKDGRFTIRGAGAERIVHLSFEGKNLARSTPYVITRRGFDPKPYNEALQKKENESFLGMNPFPGVHGPDITFVAEVGKTVHGIVKDASSGKPLAGCQLYAHTGFGDAVVSATDADGKYRLTGLPKSEKGYHISVMPPKGKAYLSRMLTAPDTGGYAPVAQDIDLVEGVIVTGRVVDKQTGKGVQAGIRFAPLTDNKFFGSKPGFDNYRSDRTMESVDGDGRFRLVTIPGKAMVMAQVHGGETMQGQHLCPYRRAVPDPNFKDLFKSDGESSWIVTTAGGLEFLSTENVVKIIDIQETGETDVELYVDRGMTGRLTVQDADGNPLAGAWIAGVTDHWPITFKVTEPTVTIYALNAETPRTLAIYHPEKQLGGIVTIRGDEKEPVIAKLGALGKLTGRLLDTDGSPLAAADVSINGQGVASELYRFANPSGKAVSTDKDGRFTLNGVIPEIQFYLQTRQGERYFGGKPKIGLLKAKPGETLNLGDRTMELLQ